MVTDALVSRLARFTSVFAVMPRLRYAQNRARRKPNWAIATAVLGQGACNTAPVSHPFGRTWKSAICYQVLLPGRNCWWERDAATFKALLGSIFVARSNNSLFKGELSLQHPKKFPDPVSREFSG